ncbi:MAG: ATP-binding protein [Bacteroidales bacterium]|jgi:signal transduction histidine kinase|nr:ATP-binding protein [Bacteroidales bacterium]
MKKTTLKPALKISLLYVIIGCSWHLLSTNLILTFVHTSHILNLTEQYKEWFYISITGILIYTLIKNEIKKRTAISNELYISNEKLEKSNDLKTAFILNISHEIRTPLNAILGFAELLKKEDVPVDKKDKYINYIIHRGNDLSCIISDLIDISKIEANVIDINKREFCVNELIDELHDNYSKKTWINNGSHVAIRTHKSLPLGRFKISSDESRIRQILDCLLSNAIKFTEKGAIDFGYNLSNKKLTFFVSDSGIGIPISKSDYIFERFTQLNSIHTKKHTGVGLGLPISKNLVERLGGKMWLETVEGHGSKFSFELPRK